MKNKSKLIVNTAIIIGATAAGIYGLKQMTCENLYKESNNKNFESQPNDISGPNGNDNNNENSVTTKTAVGYSITPTPPSTDNSTEPATADKLNLNDISDTSIKIDVE